MDIWQWAVYHNSEHFALPNEFVPERWLGDPRFANDAKRALQPFSLGPRDCVGKKYAFDFLSRYSYSFFQYYGNPN